MALISKTYWAGAPFQFRRAPDGVGLESLVLRAADGRELRALWWTPAGVARPRVAVVCMHPRVDFTHHYTFPRLLAAGIGCLGANTRNPNNDVDTVHEDIVLDLGACVAWLRARGVDRVVLLGNSGGGALAAMYQSQARKPPGQRIAVTPAGAPTRLADAEMSPADGVIYLAAHRGEGHVLLGCIDPAVADESAPHVSDPALDMYDPRNGFQPPPTWSEYSDAFLARFRAGQRARIRRLDAIARAWIADARRAVSETRTPGFDALPWHAQRQVRRRGLFQPVMTIYRTMANPRYVDRRLDPSDRDYGSLLSDRPDLMNMRLLGFGRLCTPRAWLSTWSGLASNADTVARVADIQEPSLLVHAGRDREIYPATDSRPIFEAIASPDKTFLELPQARHYFEPDDPSAAVGASPDAEALMDAVIPWIRERFGD